MTPTPELTSSACATQNAKHADHVGDSSWTFPRRTLPSQDRDRDQETDRPELRSRAAWPCRARTSPKVGASVFAVCSGAASWRVAPTWPSPDERTRTSQLQLLPGPSCRRRRLRLLLSIATRAEELAPARMCFIPNAVVTFINCAQPIYAPSVSPLTCYRTTLQRAPRKQPRCRTTGPGRPLRRQSQTWRPSLAARATTKSETASSASMRWVKRPVRPRKMRAVSSCHGLHASSAVARLSRHSTRSVGHV